MFKGAIVFAGQGAQFVGMGKDLYESYPRCRALYDKADEILGYKLSKLCFEGPEDELTRSDHCQPAIFVTSIACYEALRLEVGDLDVAGMAGLSLGEWSALHAAGAVSFEDAVKILEARGRFMQEACEERESGMVSIIGLDREKLLEICEESGAEIANINSEAQTVLSGDKSAVTVAQQIADEAGAKRTIVLNVAGAFHSSLMANAADRLESVLDKIDIKQPSVPVVANVSGKPHATPSEIKSAMVSQVKSSVNWLACVKWFIDSGVPGFCECGPGKVLSGLIKRIDRNVVLNNIQDASSLQKTVGFLNEDGV